MRLGLSVIWNVAPLRQRQQLLGTEKCMCRLLLVGSVTVLIWKVLVLGSGM